MNKITDNKRVIVALDKPNLEAAIALSQKLDPSLCRVKVGKELFTSAGPAVLDELHKLGFEIFLDLKFHDIPNTVASACKAVAAHGVWMTNVHASGGQRMMEAARDAIGTAAPGTPLLIAVTVLTSMDETEFQAMGIDRSLEDQVIALAQLAKASHLDGVVCSALEADQISGKVPGLVMVTPGIRLADDNADDQRRVMTPEKAIANGASYLVIGRAVTAATDPVARLQMINDSIGFL